MDDVLRKLAERMVVWRWPLLIAGLVMAIVTWGPARRVDFDRSIENMFAPNDPLLGPYRRVKRLFGGNEIVLAAYADESLFDSSGSGMQRLSRFHQDLSVVPGVRSVLTLDRLIGEAIVEDSLVARQLRALFADYTHSADGTVAGAVCMLLPESESPLPRRETIERMRTLVNRLPSGTLTGEPVMVVDGFQLVEADGSLLGISSTVLLALTIAVCFRSVRWVLIPLAVVQLTLLVTRASLAWTGLPLSMVSSMLTAIVTVVGVGTVIHVIVRYRDARVAGQTPQAAFVETIALLAAPVFWSCATDAVGFGSLMVADVGPVRDFGLMMAAGSMLVIISTLLVLPGLILIGRFDADPRHAWGEERLGVGLDWLIERAVRRPGRVAASLLALAVFAFVGVLRLEVETDFTKNFRQGSVVVRSYEFIESKLGGAGVLDLVVPAPEHLNWDYLERVQRLEQRLRDEVFVVDQQGDRRPGLSKVLSLSDAIIAGSPTDLANLRPQVLRNAAVRTGLKLMSRNLPDFVGALYAKDVDRPGQYAFRIMLRARERQPAPEKLRLIEQVTRIAEDELSRPDWQALNAQAADPRAPTSGPEVTGFFVLLTNLIKSLVRDQWTSFGIATAGIGLMVWLAFRSLRLALIALVPNALPIMLVLGSLGWLGLKINMGAAMIAAVSMGLSVDSSIHYLTSFQRAQMAGKSVRQALAEVQQTVGRAMVFSTLALIVGFTVLCTSQFVPTVYFGALVSLAMLGGLLGNLLVLPLLLALLIPERGPSQPEA